MEITDRIASCIMELDERRERMASFEARVRTLINALTSQGEAGGALGEALGMLEGLLERYGEIDRSCRTMIEGLREIGEHLDRIENGRTKIVEGVERILGHLNKLDEIANKGIVLGGIGAERGAEADAPSGRPKRVLVIRVRPDTREKSASGGKTTRASAADSLDEELDLLDPGDGLVH